MTNDRSVLVRVKGDISDYNRAMLSGVATTKALASQLDTSTDRATMFTQTALAIGPALVPITAAGIPAVAGLTNQLAFAAAGAGVTALAFSGVGEALKATNDYAIEPTEANLAKMRQSLAELGPAGQEFVGFLQEIRPELQGLQDAAQAGLLPGAQDGIEELMSMLPQAERIVSEVAGAIGTLLAEGGENLASPRWAEFFDFLEQEARPALLDFGRSMGNLAEGFANLWMAFDPLSDQFSDSFLQMSRDFAAWTDGLDQTEGFQEFLDYIGRVGPKAWETLGAVGNALLQIVEAAAPIGEVSLPIIEALADTLSIVANSPVGPTLIGAAAGISAVSRAISLYNTANGSAFGTLFGRSAFGGAARAAKDLPAASRAYLDFGAALDSTGPKAGKFATTTDRLGASLAGGGKLAAGIGGVAFLLSGLDEKLGVTNATMGVLIGSGFGPLGAAIGGTAGLMKDLVGRTSEQNEALQSLSDALNIGSLEQQAKALKAAQDTLAENPGEWADISSAALMELQSQYEGNTRTAQDLRFEEAGLGSSMSETSDSIRAQVDALLALNSARDESISKALSAREAERAYEEAIDNAAAAVKKNGKNLDTDTEGGRANEAAIDGIVAAYNRMAEAGGVAEGGIDRARRSVSDLFVDAGKSRKAADRLAESLIAIPDVDPTIDLNTGDAFSKLSTLKGLMDSIRSKDVFINVTRIENLLPGAVKKADGGLISGPGGPRDDVIPALLSNREYVINAAAVDHYGVGMFHALNARQYANGGYVQRFADGGMASPPAAAPTQGVASVSLRGAEIRIDKDGLGKFVKGHIDIAFGERDRQTRIRSYGGV